MARARRTSPPGRGVVGPVPRPMSKLVDESTTRAVRVSPQLGMGSCDAGHPVTTGTARGAVVSVQQVSKRHGNVPALRDVNFEVASGEVVAVTGRSGSGKSTLLSLIGGLDQPDSGTVLIDGRPVWTSRASARSRRELIGFVFQAHLLIPTLSARDNVAVPLIGAGVGRRARHARALQLLEEVGLADRAVHVPAELSGGERQRVAVARALVLEPRLLLADEPTGALDTETSARVLDLLLAARERRGMTAIIVSYDAEVRTRADRLLTLRDGQLDDSETAPLALP